MIAPICIHNKRTHLLLYQRHECQLLKATLQITKDSPKHSKSPFSGSGGSGSLSAGAAERPRLHLQPRSKPLPDQGADAAAATGRVGRPRLQLQPRTKPLVESTERRPSVFGAARPREEILKVRHHVISACLQLLVL